MVEDSKESGMSVYQLEADYQLTCNSEDWTKIRDELVMAIVDVVERWGGEIGGTLRLNYIGKEEPEHPEGWVEVARSKEKFENE